jgi:hypothetical protein
VTKYVTTFVVIEAAKKAGGVHPNLHLQLQLCDFGLSHMAPRWFVAPEPS